MKQRIVYARVCGGGRQRRSRTSVAATVLRVCVRACITSEEESFAVVVKSRHLGNSIGGICKVKFTDDINLVILI